MSYFYSSSNSMTDNERYLQLQLDQEREWRERLERERTEEYDRRQKKIMQNIEYSKRSASNWRESLQKQSSLCWREHNYYPEEGDNCYFKQAAEACDHALEIWNDVAEPVIKQIQELEEKIDQLRFSIRTNVGDALSKHEKAAADGWRMVAQTLQDKDEDCEAWLNW